MVKDESQYDRFDRVFGEYFRGIQAMPDDLFAEIPLDWLRRQAELSLTEEEKQQIDYPLLRLMHASLLQPSCNP